MVSGFDGWLSVGILAVVFALIYLWMRSQQIRFVQSMGEAAEEFELQAGHYKQAQELLEAEGYQVLGKNRRMRVDMLMHEKVYDGDLIADFTAIKDSRYFVCKIWWQGAEPKPEAAQLRGELLPLQMLYRASGCLFVDVSNDKVHVISFGL
jgi:hypothetical protein